LGFVTSFFCIFATVGQKIPVDKILMQALINARFFLHLRFPDANLRLRKAACAARGFLSGCEAAMNAPTINECRRFRD
jgi:hypothetical protein